MSEVAGHPQGIVLGELGDGLGLHSPRGRGGHDGVFLEAGEGVIDLQDHGSLGSAFRRHDPGEDNPLDPQGIPQGLDIGGEAQLARHRGLAQGLLHRFRGAHLEVFRLPHGAAQGHGQGAVQPVIALGRIQVGDDRHGPAHDGRGAPLALGDKPSQPLLPQDAVHFGPHHFLELIRGDGLARGLGLLRPHGLGQGIDQVLLGPHELLALFHVEILGGAARSVSQ